MYAYIHSHVRSLDSYTRVRYVADLWQGVSELH